LPGSARVSRAMPVRLGLSASRRNNLSRKAANATGGEESPPYSTATMRRVLRLGNAGCQPAVAGSLPETISRSEFGN